MTTITINRATVEQALEALEYFRDTAICSADTDAANEVIPDLEAALAQQAEPVEPVAAERERCAEYLMQQAAECRENSPTRVTLESCAAVLRLGLVEWVAQQAEPVEPVAWVGDPSTQDYASTVPDPQVADRLARHGIPIPEAPTCPDCHGVGYDASGQTCACQENPSF